MSTISDIILKQFGYSSDSDPVYIENKEKEDPRGSAAQQIWVKHQFQKHGMSIPSRNSPDYNQNLSIFYNIAATNYAYLCEKYPHKFEASRLDPKERELLGFDKDTMISHADLFLQRALHQVQNVDFKEVNIEGGIAYWQESKHELVFDREKIASQIEKSVEIYVRSDSFYQNPNFPEGLGTQLMQTTHEHPVIMGLLLAKEENLQNFLADPKGFIDNLDITNPEQLEALSAITSQEVTQVLETCLPHIQSILAEYKENAFNQILSHETFHSGSSNFQYNMNLMNSFARDQHIEMNEAFFDEFSIRAFDEVKTDLLSAEAAHLPVYSQITKSLSSENICYLTNHTLLSGYRVNEPIYTMLETMLETTGEAHMLQDFYAGLSPVELCNASIFQREPNLNNFILTNQQGAIEVPSTFQGHIEQPELYTYAGAFQTLLGLMNNIQYNHEKYLANPTQLAHSREMVQQVQHMLLQEYTATHIANLGTQVINILSGKPTTEQVASTIQNFINTEHAVQGLFTTLVLTRDISYKEEATQFLHETYGKDATREMVLSQPRTIEEINQLIEHHYIEHSSNLDQYLTTLANISSLRELLENNIEHIDNIDKIMEELANNDLAFALAQIQQETEIETPEDMPLEEVVDDTATLTVEGVEQLQTTVANATETTTDMSAAADMAADAAADAAAADAGGCDCAAADDAPCE